jgi:hypothetical protein
MTMTHRDLSVANKIAVATCYSYDLKNNSACTKYLNYGMIVDCTYTVSSQSVAI